LSAQLETPRAEELQIDQTKAYGRTPNKKDNTKDIKTGFHGVAG
jgi:hypothetical protein